MVLINQVKLWREEMSSRISQLTADFQNRKFEAADVLANSGREGITFLTKEIERQGADNKEARLAAISALGKSKKGFKTSVPALIKVLQNQNEEEVIQIKTVQSLQQMGKYASLATDELTRIVDEQETELAAEAALTLGSLHLTATKAKKAIPSLIKALTRQEQDGNTNKYKRNIRLMIRENSAIALSKFGKPAVPALIPLLSRNQDTVIRIQAALVLGRIGTDAQEAAPHLLAPLKEDDKKLQLVAAITLSRLNAEHDKALPVLLLHLQSTSANYKTKRERVEIAAIAFAIHTSSQQLSENVSGFDCCMTYQYYCSDNCRQCPC
ncbi:MAG: HEAT repeat domain-containing protein [Candidatus Electrothrix sp. AUS1_2]|nr:HEAT repeat domain-containing protein [Candidatus Electrothrix sp. AUS1_2]